MTSSWRWILVATIAPLAWGSTYVATAPAVILLLAWPLAAERPALLSLLGAAVGFTGVVVLLAGATGALDGFGIAASVAAMLMSSVGFVLARRWNDGTPVLAMTSSQLTLGGLALVPVALLVEGAPPALDAAGLVGAAYLSLVATALASATWFAALQHLAAGAVGLVGLLNPVAGVALGVIVAGEQFTGAHMLGMAIVVAGIVLGQPALRELAVRIRDRRSRRTDDELDCPPESGLASA
jgi:probable blue pigment (indigoidine) exporter